MPRYKLVIEYDGTPFAGWQRQLNGRSVQQAVEEAVERFAGEAVRVHCAGRTDAGVHATHQVAHLDLAKDWRTDTVRDATNAHLRAEPVAILSAEIVPDGFNARISARKRHYLYRILNRRSPPALDANRVWHVPWGLDETAMQEAAAMLVGRHDFTTFRACRVPGQKPGPHPRPSRRDAGRRRDPRPGGGALVPAPPGPLDGRHLMLAGSPALDRRRGAPKRSRRATAPAAGRLRRRRASISSASSIDASGGERLQRRRDRKVQDEPERDDRRRRPSSRRRA